MKRFVFIGFLAVGWPALATAQVNTEKLRQAQRAEGWSGTVNGNFALRQGNVNLLRLGGGFRIQYETLYPTETASDAPGTKDLAFVVGDLTFGERTKAGLTDAFVNKGFLHARWTRMWHEHVGSEVYGQVQFNEFVRLKSRVVGGLGLRVAMLIEREASIHVGSGYMVEFENLDVPAPNDAVTNHRWNNYVTVALTLAEGRLTLMDTAYFQPRLDDFGDYQILSEGELAVGVTERFSIAIGLNLRFDSRPPDPDLAKLDLALLNKLKLNF